MKSRLIPISPELAEALKRQLQAFRDKFGREPGPEDPLFFDPDSDTPQPISEEKMCRYWDKLYEVMVKIDPAKAYASRKTGRILTEDNMKFLEPHEIKEWEDAIKEYPRLFDGGREFKRVFRNVGRNDPCPCGSGKKYKMCCGVAN